MHSFLGWEFRLEMQNFDVSQNLKLQNYLFFLQFLYVPKLAVLKINHFGKNQGCPKTNSVPKHIVYTVILYDILSLSSSLYLSGKLVILFIIMVLLTLWYSFLSSLYLSGKLVTIFIIIILLTLWYSIVSSLYLSGKLVTQFIIMVLLTLWYSFLSSLYLLGPNILWTSNYGTGIVFVGNMLSWLSFHNFVW